MKQKWHLGILLAIAVTLFACPAAADKNPSSPVPDAAYVQSFDKWKAELVDDLKKNWLPLAGLFWLKPGENAFGSDPGNAVVFPKGPAHAGVFELQGTDVTVKFSTDTHATIDGKPVTMAKLQPDISGNPTVVELGTLRIKAIVRGQRIGIRAQRPRQRGSQELSRTGLLPARPVLPGSRNLGSFGWKKNSRCAKCVGRYDANSSCGYGRVQDQRTGGTVDRFGRQSFEGAFFRFQ